MKKINLLYFFIVSLILLNICSLSYLFINSKRDYPDHPPMHDTDPKNIIITALEFNEIQIKQFDKLIIEHLKSIGNINETRFELKDLLYSQITLPNDSLMFYYKKLGNLQEKIEELHTIHFKDIRAICRADQIDKFDQLSQNFAKIFNPRKAMHHPRPNRQNRQEN